MTWVTSLFNKGIFKNTLKRFKWGSILYFAILFFAIPFPILVSNINYMSVNYLPHRNYPMLLEDFYIIFPILVATIVPTIVAVLVQHNVHSAKQGIFMHGLPVSRKATFVSQHLASGVLMAAPVIANAIILLLMSFSVYGRVITSTSVIYWLVLNLVMQFIMYSIAVFSGYLTGNTAAHIGINIFLHLIPALVALIIFLVSDIFLFGFLQSDSFIANQLIIYNPIVWFYSSTVGSERMAMFMSPAMWIYILMAVGFYALGFVLYKKRKIEACGDVAAFNAFSPILKYSIVTAAVSAIFGIFVSSNLPALSIYFIAIITGAICYFAVEMILSKTVRVFGKYRGYLGFVAVAAAFICFFAFTSVCGYETRIPDKNDVEKATIYQGYSGKTPYLTDADFIKDCIEIHKSFISDIPVTQGEVISGRYLYVSYELKNGRTMNRRYLVQDDIANEVLSKAYEYEEYKLLVTQIDELNIENVTHLTMDINARGIGHTYTFSNNDAVELLKAIEKDIYELSYKEMEMDIPPVNFHVSVGISKEENDRLHYFKEEAFGEDSRMYEYKNFSIGISTNFKNAFDFLKRKGYYDNIITRISENLAILKYPIKYDGDSVYNYKEDAGEYHEFQVSTDDLIYLKREDAKALAQIIIHTPEKSDEKGEYYNVYNFPESEKTKLTFYSRLAAFESSKLPEIVKKYLQ